MNTPDTATTAGKIAVMAAFEQGKKIQMRMSGRNDIWLNTSYPIWKWTDFDYRIAESPIAAGHNPDKLTEEQVETKEGWRLLSPEEIRDRPITFDIQLYDNGWRTLAASGGVKEYTYRTLKPPGYFLPKTRKICGADWDELPVIWVRNRLVPDVNSMVTKITDSGFCHVNTFVSWDSTLGFEWSTDRKTWRPFTIEE